MKGWLLDTNVIATLINPNGAATVKAWAAGQPEDTLYLSVLTLGEYDKGIHNLESDHLHRSRCAAARDALAARFEGRILAVSDAVVRSWGRISGRVKRDTGHAPSVIDTMQAATALEHDLFLATRNVRDVSSSGAAIFNPWDDDPAEFPLS
ncbi:type II toxin-antitoxin system VapC family toxin [Sphingomonas sp. ID1715]|uniref:type II toxin-antitoxin system VapC family toxin n=1 Tax=Sphingomonas sp. ID1715 TaxID=1656898 RepID=UPI0014889E41|nr:type II toxin-antitoxin system VapC family toxin [Sphingomonas sp. ID1715]NNM77806.1 type II toxin-antitoxin system VapC family toxin [Sphingomonas sp. ID1715]